MAITEENSMNITDAISLVIDRELIVIGYQRSDHQSILKLTEAYRFLRNFLASSAAGYINLDRLMIFTYPRLCHLIKYNSQPTDEALILARVILQMISNAISTPERLLEKCIAWLWLDDDIPFLINHWDDKISCYTAALVHNAICPEVTRDIERSYFSRSVSAHAKDVTVGALRLISSDASFGLYLLQDLLRLPRYLETIWCHIGTEEKKQILHILASFVHDGDAFDQAGDSLGPPPSPLSHVNRGWSANETNASSADSTESTMHTKPDGLMDNLMFLAETFISDRFLILEQFEGPDAQEITSGSDMAPRADNDELEITVLVLNVLCEATSTDQLMQRTTLKEHPTLLKTLLEILQQEDDLGSGSGSGSSGLHRNFLEEYAIAETSTSPAIGIRSELLRLIGNLICEHRHNQDFVRDFGALPTILNATTPDPRNPFGSQWAMLCIRHLTLGNLENQAEIRGLTAVCQGLTEGSRAALQDMGIPLDYVS